MSFHSERVAYRGPALSSDGGMEDAGRVVDRVSSQCTVFAFESHAPLLLTSTTSSFFKACAASQPRGETFSQSSYTKDAK